MAEVIGLVQQYITGVAQNHSKYIRYVVDGKEFCCFTDAAPLAVGTGVKITYTPAGMLNKYNKDCKIEQWDRLTSDKEQAQQVVQKQDNRERLIIRQTCIKAACEKLSCDPNTTSKEVLALAEKLFAWVMA
jgi:hypothetical protein